MYYGSRSAKLSLTSCETVLLDYIVTAVISLCIKKITIGKFLCSHFHIEDGRKYATSSAYYSLLLQER